MWLTALDIAAAGFAAACVLYLVARDCDRLVLRPAAKPEPRWPASARGTQEE